MRNVIEAPTKSELVERWNKIVETMRHSDTELDLELFGLLIHTYALMRRRGIPPTTGMGELLAVLARDAFIMDDSDGTTFHGRHHCLYGGR